LLFAIYSPGDQMYTKKEIKSLFKKSKEDLNRHRDEADEMDEWLLSRKEMLKFRKILFRDDKN